MGMTTGSGVNAGAWIVRQQAKPAARMRLFCFPYAGGAASIYHGWSAELPASVEVCAIQLPGRQNRILEAPYTDMPALITTLMDVLAPYLDRPYAFFGHSLGAMIAFELARALRRQGRPEPVHLFVSGHRTPALPSRYDPTYHLPDAAFLDSVRRLNGTPAAVLDNAELLQLMLPLLRADFTLAETYAYVPEPPLLSPISAFGGLQDVRISEAEITAWGALTQGDFFARMLPGDHFFLHSSRAQLLAALAEDLSPWQRTW